MTLVVFEVAEDILDFYCAVVVVVERKRGDGELSEPESRAFCHPATKRTSAARILSAGHGFSTTHNNHHTVMSFDDELSSHIEHEYYDEIRPWRSAFGYPYGLLPASHVNDGLLCATDYCRYLPLRYEAINPKVSNTYRPPWMSASRNPPFRFKSFIVPRGDVLLEFDIQWLTKKFL